MTGVTIRQEISTKVQSQWQRRDGAEDGILRSERT